MDETMSEIAKAAIAFVEAYKAMDDLTTKSSGIAERVDAYVKENPAGGLYAASRMMKLMQACKASEGEAQARLLALVELVDRLAPAKPA